MELDDILLYVMGDAKASIAEEIEADPGLVARAEEVRKAVDAVKMVDLKAVLMELGNELVLSYGFEPSPLRNTPLPIHNDTDLICSFTHWINNTPAAREILARMGIDWSMPK